MGCCESSEEEVKQNKKDMGCKNSSEAIKDGGIHEQLMKTKKTGGIWHVYEKGPLLGAGMTGAVHIATHRQTKIKYAVKSINKRKLDPAQLGELKNEVDLLRRLDHPNIVRLYEVYEQGNKIYLVMQLLLGKDLGKVDFENEKQVAIVMRKVVQAISYCHSKGICHRDIKLENFVFTSEENLEDIIVIDFGIGKKVHEVGLVHGEHKKKIIKESAGEQKRNMKTICGTPYYMSPQVLDGRYDEKCDCWALGVMTYILLTRKPPFNGRYKAQLDHAIRQGVVRYPHTMSYNARMFIGNLLKVDPNTRWSCAQALKSKFFKAIDQPDEKALALERDTLERMISFQQSGKLKKLVLMVRAFSENSSKMEKLKKTFDTLDSESTGYITHEELKKALERHNILMDSKAIFDSLDVAKEGKISYTEFLAASLDDDLETDAENMRKVFDSLDFTQDGKITAKDLKHLLGSDVAKYNVKELLKEGDATGNDEISYEEFVNMMKASNYLRTVSNTASIRDSSGANTSTDVGVGDQRASNPTSTLPVNTE
mmetsp:Transcript_25037/g.34875  ORF Transcript_25037/g.34875 Transcript_25037/m.34875 type:complete len:540 (+) Transcript_25037:50-1669(+)